jgi:hypothetical protein
VEANLKKSILALCALSLAASLVACGGGSSSHTVSGTVIGLQYPGLVLTNNLSDDVAVAPLPLENGNVRDVSYQFSKQLDYGAPYSVTIKTQPQHQECRPIGGTVETAGRLSTINAAFVCDLASYTIGGTITGLTSGSVRLTNGSSGGTLIVAGDATRAEISFAFPQEVTYDQTYGVTVLEQPENQTCTVTNGAGIMRDEAVTSIRIHCVPNQAQAS